VEKAPFRLVNGGAFLRLGKMRPRAYDWRAFADILRSSEREGLLNFEERWQKKSHIGQHFSKSGREIDPLVDCYPTGWLAASLLYSQINLGGFGYHIK
jgi:hypothetical protein